MRGTWTSPTGRGGRRAPAFTLIELLVVIAIIALLVSILVPSLKQARELVKTAVCVSNAGQIARSQVLYANDNDDRLTPITDWGAPWNSDPAAGDMGDFDSWQVTAAAFGADAYRCWATFLKRANVLGAGAFACPADGFQMAPQSIGKYDATWNPSTLNYGRHRLSYGLCSYGYEYGSRPPSWGGDAGSGGTAGSAGQGWYGPSLSKDVWGAPSTKILVADTRANEDWVIAGGARPGACTQIALYNFPSAGFAIHPAYSGCYGFFDGHAENMRFQSVFGRAFDPDVPTGMYGWQAGAFMWVVHENMVAAGVRTNSGGDPMTTLAGYRQFPAFAPWAK